MTVKLKNMDSHFGDIKAIYVETKSGKDTKRPELQKLLTSIRKRDVDLVMATELSRISRSVKDFAEIWEMMQANSCGFYSLRENFDTTTAAGEMVLMIVATLAQFERRQISERVSANFGVRSKRGLFNGGSIPIGYKRNVDRPGYLDVDEESADIVRKAFSAFIREAALMPAARWLNEQGLRMKRAREGGGNRARMGHFTIDNLQAMIRNKMYIGVRVYKQNEEQKEAEAVWLPIVDRDTFDMANEILSKNKKLTNINEEGKDTRYPYLLSSLLSCKVCGDRLSGKSAHGKREKIGYYEHSWATRKGSQIPGYKHECWPYRVLAKDLESAVWKEILKVLSIDEICKEIFDEAFKSFKTNPGSKEAERYRQTVFSVEEKLETLGERLASLPSTISPTPVYKQMEKLEDLKREAQQSLGRLESGGAAVGVPVELKSYKVFREALLSLLKQSDSPKIKAQIARYLIRWIKVHPDGLDINWAFGDGYVKSALISWEDAQSGLSSRNINFGQKKGTENLDFSPKSPSAQGVVCSNMLTNGVTDGA